MNPNQPKSLLILLLIIVFYNTQTSVAQMRDVKTKYFILDTSSKVYKVTTVKLNGKDYKGKNIGIDLFNVFANEHSLILFSVLPQKGGDAWLDIDTESIKANSINIHDLQQMAMHAHEQININNGYDNAGLLKRNDIVLVVKNGNKFVASAYCITEFFLIGQQQMMFPNQMFNNIININSPNFTVRQYEDRHVKLFKEYSINAVKSKASTGNTALGRPLDKPLLFLSGPCNVGTLKGYKFWQFTDWRVADGLNWHRGIDRFIFVPELGIVAGAFDFWFEHENDDRIMGGYLNEDMFMPVLINGKKLRGKSM